MTEFISIGDRGIVRFDIEDPDRIEQLLEKETWFYRKYEDVLQSLSEYDDVSVIWFE